MISSQFLFLIILLYKLSGPWIDFLMIFITFCLLALLFFAYSIYLPPKNAHALSFTISYQGTAVLNLRGLSPLF